MHSQQRSAELFKSLAGEIRLRIVHSLFEKEKSVGELVKELGHSQSHISHHLKTLKNSGILRSKRNRHKIMYRIAPNIAKKHKKVLNLGCCEIKFKG